MRLKRSNDYYNLNYYDESNLQNVTRAVRHLQKIHNQRRPLSVRFFSLESLTFDVSYDIINLIII